MLVSKRFMGKPIAARVLYPRGSSPKATNSRIITEKQSREVTQSSCSVRRCSTHVSRIVLLSNRLLRARYVKCPRDTENFNMDTPCRFDRYPFACRSLPSAKQQAKQDQRQETSDRCGKSHFPSLLPFSAKRVANSEERSGD